jgi:MoaA/NifB/PqqE/SkfB family radical SAM enzyme
MGRSPHFPAISSPKESFLNFAQLFREPASNQAHVMGMRAKPVLQTWGRTLRGGVPALSIEITRECPLRCPGCYAYEDAHLGTTNLRSLSDFKGEELISRVRDLIRKYKPLHLSIVGGDPLVRYRELEILLPELVQRTHVHVVTSAFRPIPAAWATLPNLNIVVSIDGLQPEHDARRQPATYERIRKNIAEQHIVVHCTITSAMVKRSGYIEEFVDLWSANSSIEKIWMSIFTPQRGAHNVECLSRDERRRVVDTLLRLRKDRPKLDMTEAVIKEFLAPPTSPDRCVFAQATRTLSADFKTRVVPCQFGGEPDCSQCGCYASMGLAAVGHQKLIGPLTAGNVFWASAAIGRQVRRADNSIRRLAERGHRWLNGPGPDIPQGKDLLKVLH